MQSILIVVIAGEKQTETDFVDRYGKYPKEFRNQDQNMFTYSV